MNFALGLAALVLSISLFFELFADRYRQVDTHANA